MTNIVWTNHLEERLRQRGITKNEAFDTIKYPDESFKQGNSKWKLFKTYNHKQVVIVAVYEKNQWIILTAWTKPTGQTKSYRSSSNEVFISRLVRSILVKFVELIRSLWK